MVVCILLIILVDVDFLPLPHNSEVTAPGEAGQNQTLLVNMELRGHIHNERVGAR